MANRDKKTAFWAMTLGVVVLIAVGVTSPKDWVLEAWYLHDLEHGDRKARRRRSTCARHSHPGTWSFTSPMACINAYMVVGPTKRKPRRRRSRLRASEAGVVAKNPQQ